MRAVVSLHFVDSARCKKDVGTEYCSTKLDSVQKGKVHGLTNCKSSFHATSELLTVGAYRSTADSDLWGVSMARLLTPLLFELLPGLRLRAHN